MWGEEDLADDGAGNAYVQSVQEHAVSEHSEVFVICAQIEQEIAELEEDEKKMFLEDLGITRSGLDKLIQASYRLLGLLSFRVLPERKRPGRGRSEWGPKRLRRRAKSILILNADLSGRR